MVSLVKSSQNTTQIVYRFVPMQDFTGTSDIEWSKLINNIDEQLFDKYNLSIEEREHIKNSIKDMYNEGKKMPKVEKKKYFDKIFKFPDNSFCFLYKATGKGYCGACETRTRHL